MTVKDWAHGELGSDIWNKKYKFKDETFDRWLDRVSSGDPILRELILQKKFLFGGRILANRGLQQSGKKITFSNCFVVSPPEDNLESIYESAKKMARTYSYGGGVGIDISKLRPRDAKTNNAANNSTGAVSFMELYDKTTGLISQQGRRGALMISLDCNHPDLEEFISIKQKDDSITKANISIKITEPFMKAVKEDADWELFFDVKATGERISKIVKAKKIMSSLALSNWQTAEPGCLFWDNINDWNLLSEDDEFEYAGTNPCAEEPLPAGGSCLLGSINLSEFVLDPFSEKATFNFDDFEKTVAHSVVSLNDVLDEGLPLLPLEEQQESVFNYRQIGLGVFGLADMLLKLGIRYGSPESFVFCDKIGLKMIDTSIKTSAELAKTCGAYPKYKKEVLDSEFFKFNTSEETKELVKKYGLRNSQLLTCAPTGTISTMLGVSGGIEPIFNYSYNRRTQSLHGEDVIYKVYTPIVENYIKTKQLKDESELPDFFNNAMMLDWTERINMQSIWQKRIDASISSTVNLPENTTVEDVFNLYMYANDAKLKGITVYRDNCSRQGILTNDIKKQEETETQSENVKRGQWAELPKDIIYYRRKIKIGCGKLSLFIGYSNETKTIHDLYVVRSGSGGCEKTIQTTVIAMAGMLRLGGNIFNIEKAFEGTGGCNSFVLRRAKGEHLSKGSSCGTAILNEIKAFLKEVEVVPIVATTSFEIKKEQQFTGEELLFKKQNGDTEYVKKFKKCPVCNDTMKHTDGCITCQACGWSKCD